MSEREAAVILVVDDNRDSAELIRQSLAARGYEVLVAHDGEDGLMLFETERPALVLLDVMMPGRSGWEVCRRMKQHPEHGRRMRVIMVTALHAWDDKQQALNTGADDYATKPLDLGDLAARVERNLALVGEP